MREVSIWRRPFSDAWPPFFSGESESGKSRAGQSTVGCPGCCVYPVVAEWGILTDSMPLGSETGGEQRGEKKGESQWVRYGTVFYPLIPIGSAETGSNGYRIPRCVPRLWMDINWFIQWHKIYGGLRLANDREPVRERSGPYRYRLPKTTTHHILRCCLEQDTPDNPIADPPN